MERRTVGRLGLAFSLAACLWGCAHHRPDPFVYGPDRLEREKGKVPACFADPLADCLGASLQQSPAESLASRWRYPFHPDLHHRLCRGDETARARFLDGARQLGGDDGRDTLTRIYLGFLNGCSSAAFCDWALAVATDTGEDDRTRNLLFEGARRECDGVTDERRLLQVGASLGRSLADEPRWVNNTQRERCAAFEFLEDPWDDLQASHSAGCLDLEGWLDRHRSDRQAAAAALERCVDGGKIRYREADCLRELAGFDRERAVAFVQGHERRGWGMSSTTNRYARALLRFPETGRLEAELVRHGLIPSAPAATPIAGPPPVLADEVLESRGRLLRFNPGCSARYCEHAPLLYRLADLAGPALDDLVIEERWPALERVDLGSGPRAVSTRMGGLSVHFNVAEGDEPNSFDREHHEQLREGVERARAEPHELLVHAGRRVYRLQLRNLGEWYDLESIVGTLNTLLARRGSELRYVTLDPHCIPCARVLVGPRDGLVGAAFDGLIEIVDPFKELWTLPNFDAGLLQVRDVRSAPSIPASVDVDDSCVD